MSESNANGEEMINMSIYLLVVNPMCAWILAPRRFRKDRAVVCAILFMVVASFCVMGFAKAMQAPNYYQLLGVPRGASVVEIKRAYRSVSLELHPDRNPSHEAAEKYSNIKSALEILMDSEQRKIYDKRGPEEASEHLYGGKDGIFDEMALWYMGWAMLAYVATLGRSSGRARYWVYSGEIAMMVAEIAIISSPALGGLLSSWFFPGTVEYEMVWYLHMMFPIYVNGCCLFASQLYVDVEQRKQDILLGLRAGRELVLPWMSYTTARASFTQLPSEGKIYVDGSCVKDVLVVLKYATSRVAPTPRRRTGELD